MVSAACLQVTTQTFGWTYTLFIILTEFTLQVNPFIAGDVEDVTHTGEYELTSMVSC